MPFYAIVRVCVRVLFFIYFFADIGISQTLAELSSNPVASRSPSPCVRLQSIFYYVCSVFSPLCAEK